jgi:uncharacterized protein
MKLTIGLMLALTVMPMLGQPTAPKVRTLLITGGAVGGHDWKTVSPLLKKALEDSGRFDVRVSEEFRGSGAETLEAYDLVVVNYYDARRKEFQWPERTRNALTDFVKSGKGMVMYHFSIASFEDWPEWEKLSGANWRPNHGQHSAAHDFTVEIKDGDHPITKGLRKSFHQHDDELYANLKWQPEGSYHVLATAWDEHSLYKGKAKQPIPGEGIHQPMLWTVEYGKGRVFATVLGHDGTAVKLPGFVTTFTRGAEWAATGSVTIPVPPRLKEVTPGVGGAPPSDAVVLFGGEDMSGWVKKDSSPSGCKAEHGEMICRKGAGDAYTAAKFKSAQIHIEFNIPNMPKETGQSKGNSGVYLQGITEIQILDSYKNPTYATGAVGAIYGQYPPLVNAARKPEQWASYDIVFHTPKCNERGQELEPGSMSLFLNGVLVQDHAMLRFQKGMCDPGPLMLQDYSGWRAEPDTTMKFRNMWYRPLE